MSDSETTCSKCGGPADYAEQAQMQGGFGDDPVTVHVKVPVCRNGCKPIRLNGTEHD